MSLIKRALNAMTNNQNNSQPHGQAIYEVSESVYKDLAEELQRKPYPVTDEKLEQANKINKDNPT